MRDVPLILNTVSLLLCIASAVIAWVFVSLYSREEWRTYPAGRHLMRFTLGIAIVATWSLFALLVRWLFPDLPHLETVIAVGRVCIFGWLTAMLIGRLQLLRGSRRDATPEKPSDLSTKD